MNPVTVSLPYPPSANRLWRAVNGRQIKSADYRRWIDDAVLTIRAQRPRGIVGDYSLRVEATPPDRRRRDLDNLLKPLNDALCQAGVIGDDSGCRSILAFWTNGTIKGGAVEVTLQEAA